MYGQKREEVVGMREQREGERRRVGQWHEQRRREGYSSEYANMGR